MTDLELTEFKIGEIAIKDMSSVTFLGWVAKKLNNIEQHSPAMNELMLLVSHPPIGLMSIENKIDVIRKLEKLGIEIC